MNAVVQFRNLMTYKLRRGMDHELNSVMKLCPSHTNSGLMTMIFDLLENSVETDNKV